MVRKLVEKAKEAKSAKELAVMAHEEGIELSDAEADRYYADLHSSDHELSEAELANVKGGSCSSAAELSQKYEHVQPQSVCGDFVWAYGCFMRKPENQNAPIAIFARPAEMLGKRFHLLLLPVTSARNSQNS
jgi:hypothetical protein